MLSREEQLKVFYKYEKAMYKQGRGVKLSGMCEYEDTEQEAVLGAWRQILRLNGKEDQKRVTYKMFVYARTAAVRSLALARHLPMPFWAWQAAYNVSKLLGGDDRHDASDEEVAAAVAIVAMRTREHRRGHGQCSEETIRQAYDHFVMFLQETAYPRPDGTPSPVELAIRSETTRTVGNAVDMLPPRWKAVVRLRMEDKSFVDIAKELGVSRERCRQIYEKSLDRLRQSNVLKELAA